MARNTEGQKTPLRASGDAGKMHRNELNRMTEYAIKAIYYRMSYTLSRLQAEKVVFKISPILILNTSAKLLHYVLLENIK